MYFYLWFQHLARMPDKTWHLWTEVQCLGIKSVITRYACQMGEMSLLAFNAMAMWLPEWKIP